MKCIGISHCESNTAPYKQTCNDEPFAIHFICNDSGYRAHDSVNPAKDAHEISEVGSGLQFVNIHLHRRFHGRKHLPIHIIKKSYRPKQANNNPWVKIFFLPKMFFRLFSPRFHFTTIFAERICVVLTPALISPPGIIILLSHFTAVVVAGESKGILPIVFHSSFFVLYRSTCPQKPG